MTAGAGAVAVEEDAILFAIEEVWVVSWAVTAAEEVLVRLGSGELGNDGGACWFVVVVVVVVGGEVEGLSVITDCDGSDDEYDICCCEEILLL